jgi:hypothetical protein
MRSIAQNQQLIGKGADEPPSLSLVFTQGQAFDFRLQHSMAERKEQCQQGLSTASDVRECLGIANYQAARTHQSMHRPPLPSLFSTSSQLWGMQGLPHSLRCQGRLRMSGHQ